MIRLLQRRSMNRHPAGFPRHSCRPLDRYIRSTHCRTRASSTTCCPRTIPQGILERTTDRGWFQAWSTEQPSPGCRHLLRRIGPSRQRSCTNRSRPHRRLQYHRRFQRQQPKQGHCRRTLVGSSSLQQACQLPASRTSRTVSQGRKLTSRMVREALIRPHSGKSGLKMPNDWVHLVAQDCIHHVCSTWRSYEYLVRRCSFNPALHRFNIDAVASALLITLAQLQNSQKSNDGYPHYRRSCMRLDGHTLEGRHKSSRHWYPSNFHRNRILPLGTHTNRR